MTNLDEISPDHLRNAAELLKIFGDETRIRIIWRLFQNESNVSELAESLDLTQSAVSHQLRILRHARLVRYRREGRSTYYALDDDHVRLILDCALSHVLEESG